MKNIIIKTEALCKSFKTGKNSVEVIKNIDLEVYRGDFTVIMGSSGAGKSTLLYMLSTMDKCSSGKINLLGEDITSKSEKDILDIRRKKISFVFQGINLLNDLNVIENVTYAAYSKNKNKKEIQKEAAEILSQFGLSKELKRGTSEISGGQRQRVAIARSLINHPDIIFADEPTGALNSSSGKNVLDLLSKLNKEGQSIVMVTHDAKAAVRANRIIYLKDGEIDGELTLNPYDENEANEREKVIMKFLNSKKW